MAAPKTEVPKTGAPARQPPSMPDREAIRGAAIAVGFDVVRFARAETSAVAKADFAAFLAAGHHGDMGWLAETAARRADPKVLWPEANTAIMVGINYAPASDPRRLQAATAHGAISVYARNRDYHDVIKGRLKRFAGWLAATSGAEVKVFVDTAPLLEKPLAQAAGVGWQGKHTNLVSRQFGSWLFLGEVLTTLDVAPDVAEADHCGTCRQCLDVCPTQAFLGPNRIDARRCISYLTIEHKGPIPRALRSAIGNRIYGCDDCLAVCPWNSFARTAHEAAFEPRTDLTAPRLADLAVLDETGFRGLFKGSPIKRIGHARFLRNVLTAIGNSGKTALIGAVESRLTDSHPLVRGAAVWALQRIAPLATIDNWRTRLLPTETDPHVRDEWTAPMPE